MVLAAGSDAPQQLESIRVINNHLVLLGVHDIEKTVLRVESQANRILQSLGDLVFHLMLGIEDQDAVHFAVGDKKPVVVIDGEAVDPAEVGFDSRCG